MITIIAIDPGASGGIAWNSEGEGIQATGMPREENEVTDLLRSIIEANRGHRIVAYIELVTGYVAKPKGETCSACGQPKAKDEPGSRMFTFGRGVGIIAGALRMVGIEIHEVSPRTWQKPYYVILATPGGQRKSKPERKRILRDVAQRQFTGLEVTLKTADALLIHAYGSAQQTQEIEVLETPNVPPALFVDLKSKIKKVIGCHGDVHDKDCACDVPGAGSEFIGRWNGIDCVFRKGTTGNVLLHTADSHDLATLPKGSA